MQNAIKNNIKYLNLIAKHAPSVNRAKIEELANALQTKKLTKYKNVEKVAVMLSTKPPSADRAYNKLIYKIFNEMNLHLRKYSISNKYKSFFVIEITYYNFVVKL